ncbi:putative hydroxypyruvate reductase [Azospirillaceae bacterium]
MGVAPLDAELLLRSVFQAALDAVNPEPRVRRALPSPPPGRTVVVGAGKAAAAMALGVENHWRGDLSGLVVTRYGHAAPTRRIEVVEAGHPMPDAMGQRVALRILEQASGVGPDDLLLCLFSGGGSALLALPAPGLTLEDTRVVTRKLLRSGATISEINCVRKHMSAIKGGRLAAASGGRVVSLVMSDVVGDDPSVIASGPTVGDPTTCADALGVLARYRIGASEAVFECLKRSEAETPKPGDPRLARSEITIVASAQDALEGAAAAARANGVAALSLGGMIQGEAREVARVHAGLVKQILRYGQPIAPPCLVLSGGETTVTLKGSGQGGRNTEFLLALAEALNGEPGVYALAADTDGIDGSEDNAGALLYPDTLARATARGLDPRVFLIENDAYNFFAALEDLVITGPTMTNVNDFRAILIAPSFRYRHLK